MALTNQTVLEQYFKDGENKCVDFLIENTKLQKQVPASKKSYSRIIKETVNKYRSLKKVYTELEDRKN